MPPPSQYEGLMQLLQSHPADSPDMLCTVPSTVEEVADTDVGGSTAYRVTA